MSEQTFPLAQKPLKTVLLDRDGVINEKMPEGQYVTCWEKFHLLPGVSRAIAQLNQADLRVIVVSNQRGVSLGLYTMQDVEAIHARLEAQLQAEGAHIDSYHFCPHDRKSCDCRKPLPGMFHQAQALFPEIEAASCIMIGDSLSDIEFGQQLGMRTIFIEGNAEHRKANAEKAMALADMHVADLPAAVQHLLATAIAYN